MRYQCEKVTTKQAHNTAGATSYRVSGSVQATPLIDTLACTSTFCAPPNRCDLRHSCNARAVPWEFTAGSNHRSHSHPLSDNRQHSITAASSPYDTISGTSMCWQGQQTPASFHHPLNCVFFFFELQSPTQE